MSLYDCSMIVLVSLQRVQNSIRELQPFGRHFAINRTRFLIFGCRYHIQTMRSVTRIFFVLVTLGFGHDRPRWQCDAKSVAGRKASLCKIEHSYGY